MRKALCVGIDNYLHIDDLQGCVKDANSVRAALERNGDGTLNFYVKDMCSTSENSPITRADLKDAIEELFDGDHEIAVLYFAGHGSLDSNGGYLCTSEVRRPDEGVSMNDIMGFVNASRVRNKVIILDSCFSGSIAQIPQSSNSSSLCVGTTILAACGPNKYSEESNGSGVFTSLLVEALYGGAMNLLGEVSPGSIYSYIDRALGGWEQRPMFKANIDGFVSLRKNVPPIMINELRKITEIFENPYEEYMLDPTYEPNKELLEDKTVNKEHEKIFALLQKYVKLSLVVPVGEEHMYYAAVHSKSCKLTALGQHYWNLVNKGTI